MNAKQKALTALARETVAKIREDARDGMIEDEYILSLARQLENAIRAGDSEKTDSFHDALLKSWNEELEDQVRYNREFKWSDSELRAAGITEAAGGDE